MLDPSNQYGLLYERRDIMEGIRQYILSVVCAGILCSIVVKLSSGSKAYSSVIKLLTGIFLAITVIAPITKVQIGKLSDLYAYIDFGANSAVYEGEQMAVQSSAAIIKQEIEAYILDKASSLDMNITVDILISESAPLIPVSVTIDGKASPYAKQMLQSIISSDLGIAKENQVWK